MAVTGQELTQMALDNLAGGSPSELVRVLRLSEFSDSQHLTKNVERWRDGKHEPPTWFVMRVLESLGLLANLDEQGAKVAAARLMGSPESQPVDPLEALRVTVEAQGVAMTKALKALERASRDLARRLPPEVPAAKEAAR